MNILLKLKFIFNDWLINNWVSYHWHIGWYINLLKYKYFYNFHAENRLFQILYLWEKRKDIRKTINGSLGEIDTHNKFAHWLESNDIDKHKIPDDSVNIFKSTSGAIERILSLYFSRNDLQKHFYNIHQKLTRCKFYTWLLNNLEIEHQISKSDIEFFEYIVSHHEDWLMKVNFLYNTYIRKQNNFTLNIIDLKNIDKNKFEINRNQFKILKKWLFTTTSPSPLSQIYSHYLSNQNLQKNLPDAFKSNKNINELLIVIKQINPILTSDRQWFDFEHRLIHEFDISVQHQLNINLAGFLQSSIGLGHAAIRLSRLFKQKNITHNVFTLPYKIINKNIQLLDKSECPVIFGWPGPMNNISLTIGYSEITTWIKDILPNEYWGTGANIAHWSWETETLPPKYKSCEEKYDAIWTSSEFSRQSIQKCVSIPVEVLNWPINFVEMDKIFANKKYFSIPDDTLVFGYIFDPISTLQRKNPEAVLKAFNMAFNNRKDVLLIFKVNNSAKGQLDYECFKRLCIQDNVKLIEKDFTNQEILSFIKSLDVYVSLHRAEGFGLTCAEAMALEIPVIATGYSGNMDFMDEYSSLLVSYKQAILDKQYGLYVKGSTWCEPDINVASEMMLRMEDKVFRQELGLRGRKHVETKLAPHIIENKIKILLSKYI